MPIRLKIFSGCLVLALLTISLGLFAQRSEQRLGALALSLYDDTFMSMSYLRSAQADFAEVEVAISERRPTEGLERNLRDDLTIAGERAPAADLRSKVAALQTDIAHALAVSAIGPAKLDAGAIRSEFERTVEVFADAGFVSRRDAGALVATERLRTWIVLAITSLAALLITLLIGALIAPPVQRAVRIAESIAAGRLNNVIAARGRGETGSLLRALSVMQTSIAAALSRIQALMEAQASTHAGAMAEQHARFAAALENMVQGLCLFDANDRLVIYNQRFAKMFGVPKVGAIPMEMLSASEYSGVFEAAAAGQLESFSCNLADGRAIAVSQRAIEGGGWVSTYEDVTERQAVEARLAHAARHDQLTGLPNRLLFGERLETAVSKTDKSSSVAVLSLNLDRFKFVNDTLGHAAGDLVLQQAGERIRVVVRGCDFVARLAGDEFAIIQDAGTQPHDATILGRRITEALSAPFDVDGHKVVISTSIGIALGENAQLDPAILLKCADLALYRAKSEGGGNVCFFEAGMEGRMLLRRSLETDLRGALAGNQLQVFYQPLVRAGGGISGFEALLRWRHPSRGLVSPGLFVPIAEEMGIIASLGEWVLRQACRDAASWSDELSVAVNLSPLQFKGDTLLEQTERALAESNLPSHRLELEITESVMLQDDEKVLETLHALRRLGVRISMDDFGTGYSSLSYLRKFPFDKIKIDQSFIRGLPEQDDCVAIVRAIIGLGRSLGMTVNAEGVETPEQHNALQAEGCDELQGFLFSKPQPVSEVENLLQEHGHARSRRQTILTVQSRKPTPLFQANSINA